MLQLENISFSYSKNTAVAPALRQVSLTLKAGETLAVIGQSGSGKSTLLGILGGMLQANSGHYYFESQCVEQLHAGELARFRGEKIGFVFQNFALLPHLNLLENCLLAVEHVKSLTRAEAKARAITLLERVGIADLAMRRPAEISGGQAQRAAIARALMRNPPLILADEPTGSLDEENAAQVLALLQSLAREGAGVIVVTHSMQVAQALDRVIEIVHGQVQIPALAA